jgi:sulfide:quinone oxidoreductase
MHQTGRHRVVVAGAGIAGLEALLALHALARDHVDLTLVAPGDVLEVRALAVAEPFSGEAARSYPVADAADAVGARFVRSALQAVEPGARTARAASGEELAYDALLLALGARDHAPYGDAGTFRGHQDAAMFRSLLEDAERGDVGSIAFVVPVGVAWPLPLYELALQTAERLRGRDVRLTLVTPEPEPLSVFSRPAREAVVDALDAAGVRLVTSTQVHDVDGGDVIGAHEAVVTSADRVVAAPLLAPHRIPGVPTDSEGFVPTDEHGAVRGVPGVYAAGDGTTFPVKQGGVAAQRADAAARAIAAAAGADVEPRPFRPTLRAKLLAGSHATYLREALHGTSDHDAATASEHTLWWPPSKIAAPYLMTYLDRVDAGEPPSAAVAAVAHAAAPLHAAGDPAGGIEELEG